MKNKKILTGLTCLFIGIPLPTSIYCCLHRLSESNGFTFFNIFHAQGTMAYAIVLLMALLTIGLFTIATKELGGYMVSQVHPLRHRTT